MHTEKIIGKLSLPVIATLMGRRMRIWRRGCVRRLRHSSGLLRRCIIVEVVVDVEDRAVDANMVDLDLDLENGMAVVENYKEERFDYIQTLLVAEEEVQAKSNFELQVPIPDKAQTKPHTKEPKQIQPLANEHPFKMTSRDLIYFDYTTGHIMRRLIATTTAAPGPSLINKIRTYEIVGQKSNPPVEQPAQSKPSNPRIHSGWQQPTVSFDAKICLSMAYIIIV
ncbi:hypothetical protein H5410_019586 [Solanum commersonii]|uniref:Uncharacterized protein n=1 Tax=Solanum commersonii TaxID=4109 RepID=A0A9J5Z608_SOLCO|nr:hypothetical protein H5410_019586 [Solanum commersonii]